VADGPLRGLPGAAVDPAAAAAATAERCGVRGSAEAFEADSYDTAAKIHSHSIAHKQLSPSAHVSAYQQHLTPLLINAGAPQLLFMTGSQLAGSYHVFQHK
jgi:hypothetical protein